MTLPPFFSFTGAILSNRQPFLSLSPSVIEKCHTLYLKFKINLKYTTLESKTISLYVISLFLILILFISILFLLFLFCEKNKNKNKI